MTNKEPVENCSLKNLRDLITSDEFQEIERKIEEKPPNLFQITGIKTKEVYITKVVAWLLDPKENHGLGQEPLIAFLRLVAEQISREGDKDQLESILVKAIVGGVSGINVSTERVTEEGRSDIVLEIDDPRLLVIIENKIKAGYKESKLNEYRRWVKKKAKDTGKGYLLALFTLFGTAPGIEDFCAVAYEDWIRLFGQIRSGSGTRQVVVDQFISNMESIMGTGEENKELQELRRKIWCEHNAVMEFLTEWMPGLQQLIEDAKLELQRNELLKRFSEPTVSSWKYGLELKDRKCEHTSYCVSFYYLTTSKGPDTWVAGIYSESDRIEARNKLQDHQSCEQANDKLHWPKDNNGVKEGWLCYLSKKALKEVIREKREGDDADSDIEKIADSIIKKKPSTYGATHWNLRVKTVVGAMQKLTDLFPPQILQELG